MPKTFWLKEVKLETGFNNYPDGSSDTLTENRNILIKDGFIEEIAAEGEITDQTIPVHEAKSMLMVPAFTEKHCHLDKTLLGDRWQAVTKTNSVLERAENEKRIIPHMERTSMVYRSKCLIDAMIKNGSTTIRTHVDLYPDVLLTQLDQVLEALHFYGDRISYEIVAFPQHGLLRSGAESLMRQSLQNGANLVGGVDPTVIDGHMEKSLNTTFDLAVLANAGIDYHLHERGETGIQAIAMIADLTRKAHLQHKVSISHGFSLRDIDGAKRDELTEELKESGISLISHVPLNNTCPDLDYYYKKGLSISLGSDNIYDCWSPFGNGDLLERVNRFSEMFVRRTERELAENLRFITNDVTPLNEKGEMVWPYKGARANFILAEATCTAEMVARRSKRKRVYHHGRLCAENE